MFLLGTAMMTAGALSTEWQRARLDPRGARAALTRPARARGEGISLDHGTQPVPGAMRDGAARRAAAGPRDATRGAGEAPVEEAAFSAGRGREPDRRVGARDEDRREDDGRSRTPAGAGAGAGATFRNTYYHVAEEGAGAKEASLFDAACSPLAAVPKGFHDDVCVQGSGRLASGEVVSFAARGCECAAVCPGTGQQICFEKLDAALFPHGRGARGTPVVPLRTVAVDSDVIPLGSALFIPELVGLPTVEGGEHDGCFVAEDRGIQIKGHHIDVFTGTKAMMSRWNKAFPSNKGVHVVVGSPRCPAQGEGAPPRPRRTAARR